MNWPINFTQNLRILFTMIFLQALLILINSYGMFAQSVTYKSIRLLPNTFFQGGEKLTFQLRYGFIVGGRVTLTLEDKGNTFYVRGEAVTVGVADEIFSVKDIYESYFEKESNLPVFAIQNIKEGKRYKYYNEAIFDRKNNKVISSRSGSQDVPPDIMDMMCVFYYIRRMDLSDAKNGDTYKVNTFFFDKLYAFEIRYRGKEMISTRFGKISCHKFAPVVEPGRVFKSKDDMLIWLTDDANRIPILVSMQMVVGHIYCELIEMQNLVATPIFIPKD